jgi:hypothetical protein
VAALSADKDLAEVLKLFFLLLDLSRDVERNKDDAAFRAEGGSIAYVFDATLHEVFINPHDSRGQLTSLHAEPWRDADQASPNWDSYVAQTALSTSEYLIAGDLPGQERDRIYMTEWHRWEFKRRVDVLRIQQVMRLRGASEREVLQRFAGVRETLKRFDEDRAGVAAHLKDRQLAQDIASFEVFDKDHDELRPYLSTRLCLDVLANDRVVEPSEQLRRLVTPPLRNSFATLHHTFQPNADQLRAILADSREWQRRLLTECRLNDVKVIRASNREDGASDGTRRRSEAALWDDARSLALVRWAADDVAKKSMTSRLVFVTADQILFDAYRRWFAELSPTDPAYAEPFFMRRISQYAPVFNLVDSGRVVGQRYVELFQELLQILEVMLLPLNLSRSASKAGDAVVTRMREMTALRPTSRQPIDKDLAYLPLIGALRGEGLKDYRGRLNDMIDHWRELERAALGTADEQVEQRVQSVEKVFDGLETGRTKEAFEQYVTELVRTLLSGSQDLSLPLAREFIDEWRPPTEGLARAPIALRLTVETNRGTLAVGEMLEDRLAGKVSGPLADEDGWTALFQQPSLVFAIVAAQRVASRDWSNAQHFSEMALLAESDPAAAEPSAPRAAPDQDAEIEYLAALVKRFRMGEIGPPLTAEMLGRVQRHYAAAGQLLDGCAEYHDGQFPPQALRVMRTRSERAALNLFYSIALNPKMRLAAHARWRRPKSDDRGESDQRSGLIDFEMDEEGVRALESAEADLRACLEIDLGLPDIDDPRRQDFRYKVQRQYYTNIAAAGVVRSLWGLEAAAADRILRPTSREATQCVLSVLERYQDTAHPVMRAEALAFLALGGSRSAAQQLRQMERLEPDVGVLNLDVAIVDSILDNAKAFETQGQILRTSLSSLG